MVKGFLGEKRFLVRFQYWCQYNIYLNQLTIVIVEKIPLEKKPEVFAIPEIPEEQVKLEKGCYFCVYAMIRF